MTTRHLSRRLSPLALAAAMALGSTGLNAAPRTFNGLGSFWDVVANWTGGILPGVGDDALLGGFDSEVRTSFTINSFVGTGTLTVSAGGLNFAAASSSGALNLSGGTLAGTGNLVVAGNFGWTGGTMNGAGGTSVGGALTISGAGLKDLTGGRSLAATGTTTWTNTAADNGRIRTGAGAVINNSGSWNDQQAFSGAISPDFGGSANFNNTGSYNKNGAGSTTIGIAFNNTSAGAGTGVVAVNAGALRLTGGGSSNGSFNGVAGSTLAFGGGHNLQATSSVNTAGTVDFTGSGNNTVAGSFSAGTGTGFSGGVTTFTGTVASVGSSLSATGGTANFNQAQALSTGALTLSAGAINFNNIGGADATSLEVTGGTLGGTSTLRVSGASTWTSGTMTGTGSTIANGGMAISGAATKDLTAGRNLTTVGTTTWTNTGASNGRIRTGSGASISNNGSWLDQSAFENAISPDFGGTATFNNFGTYTKSGAGLTTIAIAFNNAASAPGTGVVAVNAGTLRLSGGGTGNGSYTGVAGTTLSLGGNQVLQAGSSINTAGTVDFFSGTNTLAGSFNAGTATTFTGGTTTFTGTVSAVGSTISSTAGTGTFNNTQPFVVSALTLTGGGLNFNNTGGTTTGTLDLTGGTLGGTSTVTVIGATTWASGTMTGSGTTVAAGTLTISGAAVKDLTGGRNLSAVNTTWTNTGASNGRIRTGGSAVIENNGSWADQLAFDSAISADFGGSATLRNNGVYTKSGNAITTIGIAFDNTSTGAGTGVVNVNAGTLALNGGGSGNGSFQGAGTLSFGGGVYNLVAGSSIANPNVVFASGTTNVGGSYGVSGTTTVSGGIANFTGSVANSGGSLIVSSGSANFSNSAGVTVGSLALSGGTVGGTQDLSVTGATTWTAGTMTGSGRTLANGTLVISGAGLKDITGARTLTASNTTWTNTGAGNGRMRTAAGAVINNTGTWTDQQAFDSGISPDFGGSASFNNTGTYNKAGAGITTIAIAFNNTAVDAAHGIVNVNAGTLVLSGGGTGNGSFQGASTLAFGGGTQDLLAGSSVSNANVFFSGGVTNLAGSYGVAGTTTVNGGIANFTGSVLNSGGSLVVSSGAANFSNAAGVTMSTLNLSGGQIGGTQSLLVSGDANWSGGTMTAAGSTTVAGTLTMAGANLHDLTGGRTLNTNGNTVWTNTGAGNGRIRTGGAATLNNNGSWLDQLAFTGSISPDFGGAATFNNIGSYTKSGAASTDFSIAFVNGNATPGSGVVNLSAGTLALGGGGSSTGSFNIADGSTLAFTGSTYTLGGSVASAANGRVLVSSATVNTVGAKTFAGLLEVAAGTLNINADATAARYLQTGATLAGSNNLTITGDATWSAGTMTGPGSTTTLGTLTLAGAGLRDLPNGRTLNANGTTTWTNTAAGNGRMRTGGSTTINNNGSWLDQLAFAGAISPDFGGSATFNNIGSYTKSGAATTDINIAFVNGNATPGSGVVNLDAGTLALGGGGNNAGSFNIADGSTLAFNGGTYTLGGVVNSAANGRVLVNSGTVNTVGTKTFGGLLELAAGALNVNADATTSRYLQSGGTLAGTATLTVTGDATWAAGAMSGTGSTTTRGPLTLAGAGLRDLNAGRTLNTHGTTTWTNTAAGNGRLRTAAGVTINNEGNWQDLSSFSNSISPDLGGTATFNNIGSYLKVGAGTTGISIVFNNPGRVNVANGQLDLTGGLTNFAGSTLSGGTFEIFSVGTLRFTGANIVTNAATLLLSGGGSELRNATNNADALAAFSTNAAAGSFTITNGRNFASVGPFLNAGVVNIGSASTFTAGGAFTNQVTAQLQMAGGSFAGTSLANAGVVSGFGSVAPVVSNSGTTRASGGTLNLAGGVLGAPGTVVVDSGATLQLGGTSSAGTLNHNGTLLALGANNITVFNDYDSANFGVGNNFNRRGGVSGTGQILASGTAQQTLSGAQVLGGNTANATLVLPTIRVGLGGISGSFTLGNVGVGGPALRGALVTTGITNAGLSGSGVTAQNWGAITQFSAGQNFSVNFDPAIGQALSGQVLQVVNNFDNVAGQTLTITGEAFNLASASAATPSPVVFANQRVGGTLSQALTLANTAPNSGFSENLNASIAASGAATAGGSFSLLAAGSSSNALFVGIDTGSAGAKSGTATITLVSDGTGTSGLAPLGIGTQTVNVSGNVYRLAQPSTVNPNVVLLGNLREGGTLTQALTLANLAAADGFSESLNASISGSAGIVTGGSFTQLAAGSSSNSLFVGVDASTAGTKTGTATITLASDGTGSSGFSPFGLGTQLVSVNATVFRLASASAATPSPLVLADQRVGGTLTQALSITNTAAADGFSEGLSATIGASGTAVAGGSFSLLAAGASSNALFVGVDTSSAGAKGGTATIALSTDGAGSSGFGGLGIGTQNVAVSGNVYRLAQPVVDTTPLTLVARVGDAALSRNIGVSNNAPDLFTERLNASLGSTPAGMVGGPALVGLLPNASGSLSVGLATTTAGTFGGQAVVSLVSSSAGTSSGAADFALGSVNVPVTGRIYAPAVAQVAPTVVDFGTVRVGDVLAARGITVANGATGALTDTLQATLGGGNASFGVGGTVSGLAAGASNNTALTVQMNTATAGVFSGNATLAFNSQNPEMADLALTPANITLQGQVNNLANAALAQSAGAGTFSGTAFNYTLDFGSLQLGSGISSSTLTLANAIAGPADALAGSWDLSGLLAGNGFTVGGFGSFTGLAAGDTVGGLTVSFDASNEGSFSGVLVFNGLSTNSSGPDLALPQLTLQLHGNVVAVPEPGTWGMMFIGILAMGSIARRRLRAQAA